MTYERVEVYLQWMGRVVSFTLRPHANRVTDTHCMGRRSLKTGLTIVAKKVTSAPVRNETEGV
jgi:hypothetical protein